MQGFVKGEVFCFRYPYFYFRHGESSSSASQKSKDLNKVLLLLQDLRPTPSKHYKPNSCPKEKSPFIIRKTFSQMDIFSRAPSTLMVPKHTFASLTYNYFTSEFFDASLL